MCHCVDPWYIKSWTLCVFPDFFSQRIKISNDKKSYEPFIKRKIEKVRFCEPTRNMSEWAIIKEYKIISEEVEYGCSVHCAFQPRY